MKLSDINETVFSSLDPIVQTELIKAASEQNNSGIIVLAIFLLFGFLMMLAI